MICKNCGNHIEADSLFCNMCGARADTILPPETAAELTREQYSPEPDIPAVSYAEPVRIEEEKRYPYETPAAPAPVREERASEKEQEKGFFGVGAFVLCAVVIGLLSVSTGVFAALYFTVIGR